MIDIAEYAKGLFMMHNVKNTESWENKT